MAKAVWNQFVLAESDRYEVVEGNLYFPPDSLKTEYFEASDYQTSCGWKGTAHYYNVKANGEVNANAAWCYPEPKAAAQNIKGYVAFWKGIQVSRD
ncbi:MAG: DUF427 domain-containing protein [Cyanobacteria bacterium P01_H01_bin.121]